MDGQPSGRDRGDSPLRSSCYSAAEWESFRTTAYRVAHRSVTHHYAEDVAIVVMQLLHEREQSGQKPDSPHAWVRGYAKWRTLDLIRMTKRELPRDATVMEAKGDQEQDRTDDLVAQLRAKAIVEEVLEAAEDLLSPRQYEAFLDLYYLSTTDDVHQLSDTTIAQLIIALINAGGGVAPNPETVRTHWRRAVAALKEQAKQGRFATMDDDMRGEL